MKWFEIVSILVGGGLLIWVSYGLVFESSIEQPSYEVVLENNHFEIRQYSKIKVIGDNKSNSGNAFRSLFNYINGNNNENKKIPMTAPVIEKNQSMLFVLPASLESPPRPKDNSIKISEIGPIKVAVKSFYGSTSKAEKLKLKLERDLTKNNVTFTTNWFLCQYNSPWVFPLFRKNEIWIELN